MKREVDARQARSDGAGSGEAAEGDESGSSTEGILGDVLVERLMSRLQNRRATVRERAAWLLGTTGNRRAVEPLITLLSDDNQRVSPNGLRIAQGDHGPGLRHSPREVAGVAQA